MTQLQIAKSRTAQRTETNVSFRNALANPAEWEGISTTVNFDAFSGGRWGSIEQPRKYRQTMNAFEGGTTSVRLSGAAANTFNSYSLELLLGGKLRVMRVVNGELQLIRTATITGGNLDYLSLGINSVVTGNTAEFSLGFAAPPGVYTVGVARIGADNRLGPVSLTTVTVPDAPIVQLPVNPTTTGRTAGITGRNAALPAVTGLVAGIRSGSTQNVELSWDAASGAEFATLINWDGSADRISDECTLSFDSGPMILTNDMLIVESPLVLTTSPELASRRAFLNPSWLRQFAPFIVQDYSQNIPGGRTWEYVPYGGANLAKPDITFPNHYLKVRGTPTQVARVNAGFHDGDDQQFYAVLQPGRTYQFLVRFSVDEPMNVLASVQRTSLATPASIPATSTPQVYQASFTVPSVLGAGPVGNAILEGTVNGVAINILDFRVWESSLGDFGAMRDPPPISMDLRDHSMIKRKPFIDELDALIGRAGFGQEGSCFDFLLRGCRTHSCNPLIQFEWVYDDQVHYDLVTYLCAPAASGEPLALKREAMGFGPIQDEFSRWLYEDGNERWLASGGLDFWTMYGTATDSVTGQAYDGRVLSRLFAQRRLANMKSNPYWPTSNPPLEFVGGWIGEDDFTVEVARFPEAYSTSVALYAGGWEANGPLVIENANSFGNILGSALGDHTNRMTPIAALAAIEIPNVKLTTYECGPGYRISGVTAAQEVVQEVVMKSVGSTTAAVTSMAIAATLGFRQYNLFSWATGAYWKTHRTDTDGGGLYRWAAFMLEMYNLLGRSQVYDVSRFINRQRPLNVLNANGTVNRVENIDASRIFQFHSIDYPGRVGILYCNTKVNFDVFDGLGDTGEAEFRYHTNLPSTATPFKVLRNEGNMRYHDAYLLGFRPGFVGATRTGYVEDPLCVDLTVTPEDFTVDDPTLRTLTLLGGNCRLEIFET